MPLRLDDAAIADLVGQAQASVDNRVDLATDDPAGLTFQSYGIANAMNVPARTRLTLGFPGLAWDLVLKAADFGDRLIVEGFAAGLLREQQILRPGDEVSWRTRGLDRVEITGDGGVSYIGSRLADFPYQWTLLGHRSLPVSDVAYPDLAKPASGAEAEQARSRLPASPAADWASTYGPGFPDLLATLTALALGRPASPPPSPAGGPRLSADGGALLSAALVDPHIARIVGLAWDDTQAATLTGPFAYKVVGRWRGGAFSARPGDPGLDALGLRVTLHGTVIAPDRTTFSYDVDLGVGNVLEIGLGTAVDELVLELLTTAPLEAVAFDGSGGEVGRTAADHSARAVTLSASGITRVELHGGGRVSVGGIRWSVPFEERYGLIPGIGPADPGPPAGPNWITARRAAQDEGRRIEVELDWDLAPGGETAAIGVQLGALRFGSNPAAPAPEVPPFQHDYLLRDGTVVIIPPDIAARPAPRVLTRDVGPSSAGLSDGWYAWWARGVDLFGRCGPTTPPAVLAVTDDVPPPPPALVLAEYVQAAAPASLLTVLGRSPLASAWLAAHPGRDALACCAAWTPELAKLAPDVDAFRVYVRRPRRTVPASAADPAESYSGVSWGASVASTGPVPTTVTGTVVSAATTITGVAVTEIVAEPANRPDEAGPPVFRLTTDLTLDTGSGELTGAVIQAGGVAYTIVGNGEGPSAWLLVRPEPGGPPPEPGPYVLRRGTSSLLAITTGIVWPASGEAFVRASAGVLAVPGGTDGYRYRVLGFHGDVMICADRGPDDNPDAAAPAPTAGMAAVWYPAWTLTFADTGFGPATGEGVPVGRAQVALTSVRRSGTARAVQSAPSAPGTVLAVDTTVPAVPILPDLLSGPHCAVLATAADWYGVSRFTLSFPADPGTGYLVFRAMAASVFTLDHQRRAAPGYALDLTEPWMAPLLTGARGTLVTSDLAALETAVAAASDGSDAVEAAYELLHADTARLIAAQSWTAPAYTQRHATPLTAAELPYIDELEGRSRSHWFYRVAARSAAGLASSWSAPTPPICAPNRTPPPAPVARLALADDLAVTVSWLPVPADVDHYLLYRGRDDAEIADVRDLLPVLSIDAATAGGGPPLQASVPCEAGEWRFRIVAVDAAGNRSRPSQILVGRALLPPPPAPVWLAAVREGDGVRLTWRPSGSQDAPDPRLACLVERRLAGVGWWSSVSGWLPRAVYIYLDAPPDPAAGWDYRLRVRDRLGQVASVLPVVSIARL
ncbi:hypothetical protein [Herbidospora mongoliensis]|uniref:hypothetical protein n=1 Tax=Herbidospora mongoliensis TaxID=688067 RepID=UPI0012F8C262|nr:hypothetical protein [Herbidospora mongoliensis]